MAKNYLEGVSALTQQLLDLGKLEDGRALTRACKVGLEPAYIQAISTIPVSREPHRLTATYGKRLVSPGFARDSVRIASKKFDGQKASAFLTVKKAAFYAALFIEFGTRFIRPEPWLRRALRDNQDKINEAFFNSMQKSVITAVKKAAK